MSEQRAAGPETATRLTYAELQETARVLAGKPTGERLTEAAARITEVAGTSGREWDVLLIQAGASKNGRDYPATTLRAAAPLFEGVPCYARHRQQGEGERHPLDKVGKFTAAQWNDADQGITARLRVVNPQARALLMEMHEQGDTDFVGFSIDASGEVDRGTVRSITKAHSVDLVAEPAAGGRLQRLVASADYPAEETDMDPEAIKALVADAVKEAIPGIVSALTPAPVETPAEPPKPEPVVETAPALPDEDRLLLLETRVDRRLAEATGLSEPGRAFVKKGLMGRKVGVTDDLIAEAVTAQMDYEAAMRPVFAQSSTRLAVGDGTHDKFDKALHGWFMNEDIDGVKRFNSIKEAYCRWTGQDSFEVDVYQMAEDFGSSYNSRTGHKRIRESVARASWGEIFADNLYVMMINDFRRAGPYDIWRQLVSDIENVPDFQTRHWARVGGYGDFSTVAEGATYPTLTSPTDEEITYSISKRGGLDDVTFETLIDGRSNRMQKVPTGMSRAAKRTLYRDIMDMFTTDNSTMPYDTVALYNAAHGNTGTTALSVAGLDATQVAMRDQTPYNESAEILGARNKIKTLIVPAELEARALRIASPSDGYTFALSSTPDGDTSMDPARFKGYGLNVIVYDHLTNAKDWWSVADPSETPTAVVGFLNGQSEPELWVADNPAVGSMLSADRIVFKSRIIYGFAMLDHRSVYYQDVA